MIIGITGRKRSGKTTVANYLMEHYKFRHLMMAGPLKEACAILLRCSTSDFEGDSKEQPLADWGFSPRWFMQQLGTEFLRDTVDPDFHVKLVKRQIEDLDRRLGFRGDYVIADIRFENEARFIRERGGMLIAVERPDLPPPDSHISEAGITVTEQDYVVSNGGTKEDLYEQIDRIMRQVSR